MEQFFDFEKEKVQSITLEQLERTHRENDIYGKPLRGIYHFQLIHDILALAREQGYNVEVYDMFAAQNRERQMPGVVVLPQVEEINGKNAVEAHILRRVYANVRLTDFDDEIYTTNLAIAFHQRGIQVGFGNMVQICHNQCMLYADHYAATYSDRGAGRRVDPLGVEDIKDIVRSWLMDARHIIAEERETIEKMKEIEVSAEKVFMLIGLLTAMRVKVDSSNKEIHENAYYPLNQAQICQFTENLLLHFQREGRTSVWDIYNAATELYKARTLDMPHILPQNRAMVKVLREQFEF